MQTVREQLAKDHPLHFQRIVECAYVCREDADVYLSSTSDGYSSELVCAFVWAATSEGQEYWSRLNGTWRAVAMHNTIDYSKSPAPAFDAVEDIRKWLGEPAYSKLIEAGIGAETNCGKFALYCSFAGIKGFPVKAWYEHFHGQGSWKAEELEGL